MSMNVQEDHSIVWFSDRGDVRCDEWIIKVRTVLDDLSQGSSKYNKVYRYKIEYENTVDICSETLARCSSTVKRKFAITNKWRRS